MNDEPTDGRAKVSAAAERKIAARPIPREAMKSGAAAAAAIALENYEKRRAERPSSS